MSNIDEYIKKSPFYILWSFYVLKIKKFPYFMYFPEYNKLKKIKQGLWILMGFLSINAIANIINLAKSENNF